MARIRTIKPEFWADEKLAPMRPIDRLVFLGLISMADDGGRLLDHTKPIDAFIFPYTDHSAADSVDALEAIGRLKRGVTASGQRVIQIKNWRHQRIDRPNLAGSLPPIAGDSPEAPSGSLTFTNRAKLSQRTREAVWSAAHGRCQECGVECIREKADKYDARPNLGEVDHVVAVRDGGTDDLENLRLLCLRCNRQKAGREASTRNRGNAVDQSTKARGTISVPVPVPTTSTNDQRPTTGTLGGSGLMEDPNFGKVPTEKDRQARLDAARRLGFKLPGAA